MTSDGPATLHASFLETTAAGPSARVRPMVKGGGGGKAGDHGVDVIEGAEQATLSTCGKRTAMDEAGSYGFGTWLPESLRRGGDERRCRDLPRNRFKRTPAAGPSARVRPREKNGGGGKAGNRDDETWHDAREDWGKRWPKKRRRPAATKIRPERDPPHRL